MGFRMLYISGVILNDCINVLYCICINICMFLIYIFCILVVNFFDFVKFKFLILDWGFLGIWECFIDWVKGRILLLNWDWYWDWNWEDWKKVRLFLVVNCEVWVVKVFCNFWVVSWDFLCVILCLWMFFVL